MGVWGGSSSFAAAGAAASAVVAAAPVHHHYDFGSSLVPTISNPDGIIGTTGGTIGGSRLTAAAPIAAIADASLPSLLVPPSTTSTVVAPSTVLPPARIQHDGEYDSSFYVSLELPTLKHAGAIGSSDIWNQIPRGGDDGAGTGAGSAGAGAAKDDNDKDNNAHDDNNGDDDDNQQDEENPIVKEILNAGDDYYRILGLFSNEHQSAFSSSSSSSHRNSSISQREIQKAYRRRAVQTHPDKTGGDRRAFDQVARAFEVLGDEATRSIYDKYGVAGLDPTTVASAAGGAGRHPQSFSDLFQSMFHHQQKQQQQARNRTVRYQLQVSLEDLYKGTTQDIWIPSPSHHHRYTAAAAASSNAKKGKTVQLHVPRGAIAGQPIVLSGAMDFATSPNAPPADLIFVVTPAPHPIFTRKNHDLAMELTISLEEAICGIENRNIQHLNGQTLTIASATTMASSSLTSLSSSQKTRTKGADDADGHGDGDSSAPPLMIATGDVQVLKGWGFPKSAHGGDDAYGDLYIQFKVDMPKASPPAATTAWKSSSKRGGHHPLLPEERQELRRLLAKVQGREYKNPGGMGKGHQESSAKPKTTTTTSSSTAKPRPKKKIKKKQSSSKATKENDMEMDQKASSSSSSSSSSQLDDDPSSQSKIYRLVPGKVSDFGRATGQARWQPDDHDDDHHHDQEFFPSSASSSFFDHPLFGSGSSTFFQSSGGTSTRTQRFYFGSHPFDGEDGEPGAAGAAQQQQQCQQM